MVKVRVNGRNHGQTDRRTDNRTDGQTNVQTGPTKKRYTPLAYFICRGYNNFLIYLMLWYWFHRSYSSTDSEIFSSSLRFSDMILVFHVCVQLYYFPVIFSCLVTTYPHVEVLVHILKHACNGYAFVLTVCVSDCSWRYQVYIDFSNGVAVGNFFPIFCQITFALVTRQWHLLANYGSQVMPSSAFQTDF